MTNYAIVVSIILIVIFLYGGIRRHIKGAVAKYGFYASIRCICFYSLCFVE